MIRFGLLPERDDELELLCLGAHGDDIEIGCGATLIRLAEERPGLRVHWVVFSGDETRAAEARASADRFRESMSLASMEIHRVRDGYFPSSWAEIKDLFESLKTTRNPDLILTHWGQDAHQDHRVLSELAWNTWRNHLILEYEIPKYDGDLGRPNFYVPVSESTARRKVEFLLESFGSQIGRRWFSEETFLGLMRLRAVEAQCAEPYAEAFHCRKCVI